MKKYQQFVNNVKNKTVYLRYMKNINSNNLKNMKSMMSYTDAENGKVALMQEILGVKDIQDIDMLYGLHQEFMDYVKRVQEQEIVKGRVNFHDFSKTKKEC